MSNEWLIFLAVLFVIILIYPPFMGLFAGLLIIFIVKSIFKAIINNS
jgi:hypothetical protein